MDGVCLISKFQSLLSAYHRSCTSPVFSSPNWPPAHRTMVLVLLLSLAKELQKEQTEVFFLRAVLSLTNINVSVKDKNLLCFLHTWKLFYFLTNGVIWLFRVLNIFLGSMCDHFIKPPYLYHILVPKLHCFSEEATDIHDMASFLASFNFNILQCE